MLPLGSAATDTRSTVPPRAREKMALPEGSSFVTNRLLPAVVTDAPPSDIAIENQPPTRMLPEASTSTSVTPPLFCDPSFCAHRQVPVGESLATKPSGPWIVAPAHSKVP